MSRLERIPVFHTTKVAEGNFGIANRPPPLNIHEKGALLYPIKIDVATGTATDIADFGSRSEYAGISRVREIEIGQTIKQRKELTRQTVNSYTRREQVTLWNSLSDQADHVSSTEVLNLTQHKQLVNKMLRRDNEFLQVRNELVLSHLPLVRAAVLPHIGKGVSKAYLESAAHELLVGAAERYDPEKGYFASFAYSSIRLGLINELKFENEIDEPNDTVVSKSWSRPFDEARIVYADLYAAISGLDVKERRVIYHAFWEGLTQGETAERLRESYRLAGERLNSALNTLRSYFSEDIPSSGNKEPTTIFPASASTTNQDTVRRQEEEFRDIEETAARLIAEGVRLTGPELKKVGYSAFVDRILRKEYPGGIRNLRKKFGQVNKVATRRDWKNDLDPKGTVSKELEFFEREHGPFTVSKARRLGYAWLEKAINKYVTGVNEEDKGGRSS